MTHDAKSPDVSYVTEPQRRWIEHTYGDDWDKPKVIAIDTGECIYLSPGDPVDVFDLVERFRSAIGDIPDGLRHTATVTMSSYADGDCRLSFKYNRVETERDFSQRIASYIHRWEKIRNENLKEKTMFGLG